MLERLGEKARALHDCRDLLRQAPGFADGWEFFGNLLFAEELIDAMIYRAACRALHPRHGEGTWR